MGFYAIFPCLNFHSIPAGFYDLAKWIKPVRIKILSLEVDTLWGLPGFRVGSRDAWFIKSFWDAIWLFSHKPKITKLLRFHFTVSFSFCEGFSNETGWVWCLHALVGKWLLYMTTLAQDEQEEAELNPFLVLAVKTQLKMRETVCFPSFCFAKDTEKEREIQRVVSCGVDNGNFRIKYRLASASPSEQEACFYLCRKGVHIHLVKFSSSARAGVREAVGESFTGVFMAFWKYGENEWLFLWKKNGNQRWAGCRFQVLARDGQNYNN